MLALAFSLYLLAQKETLTGQAKKVVRALFSEKWAHWITDVARMTNRTFSNFVTGQLTEAVILGTLCFLGMLIFRLPYAGVISVLVGFTALIPIFGAFSGVGIGAFLILLVSPIKALWFVLFFVILQQLEGNLIYPRVVGKSVGLPGIWVLAAVTVGGNAFGLAGMLLAVPLCSVLDVGSPFDFSPSPLPLGWDRSIMVSKRKPSKRGGRRWGNKISRPDSACCAAPRRSFSPGGLSMPPCAASAGLPG